MRKLVWLFLSPILLSSCAIAPQLTEAEIDPGPYPDNYEAIIRDFLREHLVDPDSLRDFSIDACTKVYLDTGYPRFNLKKGQAVYECKYVWYNAKNQMGGYTGKSPHIYYIRHDKVVAGW